MRTSFALASLLFAGHPSATLAQTPGTFKATAKMTRARYSHTATLLPNGKVLLTGGWGAGGFAEATAEIYDLSTGAFTATGNLITARAGHSATLLADGKVFVFGGLTGANEVGAKNISRGEIYDPSTGTFTATGDTINPLPYYKATLLQDGRVLIAGSAAAQVYDPVSGIFEATGPYVTPGGSVVTATLLADGKVLMTGCGLRCDGEWSQLYDPGTGTFSTAAGYINNWYNVNTATLLMNGKVLVAGSDEYAEPADAELYDPPTGTFTRIARMTATHEFSAAVLLSDGTVLITGSQLGGGGTDASAELYDAASGTFTFAGYMTEGRFLHTATLLPDGEVLIAGGYPRTSSAELYKPAALVPSPALFSLSEHAQGQGAILHSGTDQVVSADSPGVAGEVLEVYCTGLSAASLIPPRVAIGGRTAEILFFGKAPGYANVNQVNVRVPSGVVPGPAVPVRLNYLGRPSNEVTIGVREPLAGLRER